MFDKYFKLLKTKPADPTEMQTAPDKGLLRDGPTEATAVTLSTHELSSTVIDTSDIVNDQIITDTLAIDTHGAQTSTPEMLRRFVGREPVLDATQQIIGYEFSLRNAPDTEEAPTLQQMCTEMLIASLIDLDIPAHLGTKYAFIGIVPIMLNSSWLSLLPSRNVILAIDIAQTEAIEQTVLYCRQLIEEGFRIAVDNATPRPELADLLSLASYARIDTHQFDALALAQRVMGLLSYTNATLIARNVESEDSDNACRAMAFGGFQGYYFTQLQPGLPHRIDNTRLKVLELLNMVRNHADIAELEAVLKRDALLSYKLLSYLNAPCNGLTRKLDSLTQALVLLGYKPLYRWLTLLLFTSGKRDARGESLLQNSLIRARLTETLAGPEVSPEDRDSLFVTGMFSLLDALLNVPMQQALAPLNLSDALTQALLNDHGIYAPYLRLAIACETANQQRIAALAAAAGVSVHAVNLAHVKALLWANEFSC